MEFQVPAVLIRQTAYYADSYYSTFALLSVLIT